MKINNNLKYKLIPAIASIGMISIPMVTNANTLTTSYVVNFRLADNTPLATGVLTDNIEEVKDKLVPTSKEKNIILDKGNLQQDTYRLTPLQNQPMEITEIPNINIISTLNREEILTVTDELNDSYGLDFHNINYDYQTIKEEFSNGNISLTLEPLKEVTIKESSAEDISFNCTSSQFELIDNELVDLEY